MQAAPDEDGLGVGAVITRLTARKAARNLPGLAAVPGADEGGDGAALLIHGGLVLHPGLYLR